MTLKIYIPIVSNTTEQLAKKQLAAFPFRDKLNITLETHYVYEPTFGTIATNIKSISHDTAICHCSKFPGITLTSEGHICTALQDVAKLYFPGVADAAIAGAKFRFSPLMEEAQNKLKKCLESTYERLDKLLKSDNEKEVARQWGTKMSDAILQRE